MLTNTGFRLKFTSPLPIENNKVDPSPQVALGPAPKPKIYLSYLISLKSRSALRIITGNRKFYNTKEGEKL